ncbi:hypothetical protein CTM_02059 [Clostridium tetanomorphum DSM 665]|uniref:PilZ domain-containing protein n=1 Tax=Clostridium tetanomorphum TaxID=1553 RepID=A0A923IZQ2_CLOTT|nr:PilZ domain-containing protein [Clostridium tetanomorphum]KAJ53519.1 hypothetical protein CTM_02059 [Clostridium tetanomorphum DSM 665]MBC2396894.1 PilZ domain-containing protein [Clostridium tetanomorphum]MBP1863143.1 hypothetical protein [Clostridium tetanomorphum]NRZ97465.1 hypothetical protein [Clostridium tetanomorphum]SQB92428.1 PilZ domain [Clostridium tetanomorphum]
MSSNIYKKGEYIYKINEKRSRKRAQFDLDIHYPRINDKSMYIKYETDEPLMKGINISSTGILLLSKVPVKTGDFISFSMRIGDYPSFWCLCEAKWVNSNVNNCLVGCEFFSLTMQQINTIKEYVENSAEIPYKDYLGY